MKNSFMSDNGECGMSWMNDCNAICLHVSHYLSLHLFMCSFALRLHKYINFLFNHLLLISYIIRLPLNVGICSSTMLCVLYIIYYIKHFVLLSWHYVHVCNILDGLYCLFKQHIVLVGVHVQFVYLLWLSVCVYCFYTFAWM